MKQLKTYGAAEFSLTAEQALSLLLRSKEVTLQEADQIRSHLFKCRKFPPHLWPAVEKVWLAQLQSPSRAKH